MASSASDCRSPGPCAPNQDIVYALPSHLCSPLCMFMARRGVKLQSAPRPCPGLRHLPHACSRWAAWWGPREEAALSENRLWENHTDVQSPQ